MSFADIPLSSQTAPVIEFEVLWTPQRHQKNKKWHDGFMKLHTFNNRLMVTDEDRNPICNKFHTDGARIDVEDTIIFENHIVEVLGVKGQTEQDLRALFEKTAERRQAIGRSDDGTPASSRASPPPTLPRNLKPPPGNMIALNRGGGRRVGLTRSASGAVAARPPAVGSGLGRGRSLSGVLGGQHEPRQRQTNQGVPQMPPPPVPRNPALQQQRRQRDDTPAVPVSKAAVSAFKPPMSAQTATAPQQHQQPQVIHKTPQQPAPRKLNQTKKTTDPSRANIPQRTSTANQPLPPPKNTPIKESPSTVPIKESPASTRNDVVDISSDEGEEDKDMAQYTNAENTIRRNREQRESQLANWDNQFRRLKSNSPTPQQPRKQPRKQAKTRPREPPQQQQPQQERQVRQIQQEEEEQLQPTSSIPSKRGRDEFEDEHEDDDMDDDDLAAIEEAVKRNREALQRSDLSSPVSEEQPQQQVAPEIDMTDEPEVTVQVEEARQEPAAAATATTTVTATATATVNNKEAGPPRLLQLQSVTTKEPRRMLLCRPTKEKSSNIPSRNVSDLGFKNLSFEDKDKVDEDAEDSEEVPIAAQKTRKTKAATKAATAKKPAKAAKVSKTTKANKKAAETEQNVELTNDEADNQEQPNATKRPKKTRATKKKVTISEPNAGAQTTEAEESEQPAPRSRKKLKQSATTADTDPKGKKKAQARRRGRKASPETVEIPSSPPPAAVDEANYEPVGKNTEDQEIEDNFDIASSPFIGTNVFDGIESTAQAMRVPTPEPIIEEEQEEEEDPFADFPKQGPWTVEAYDLFSWRPPGKEGLFL